MLLETPDIREQTPELSGEQRADVCIVGGGYLGLWTAIRLLEVNPRLSIRLVEADICGSGASGRNSGMALAWWPKFQALVTACGTEEALRLCRASQDAIAEIEDFCVRHGIDAEFVRSGWIWGATCLRQEGRWIPVVDALAGQDAQPFRTLDRNDVQALVEAPGYRCGVLDESAATIQPAKLVRGLRRVAIEMGAAIHERSPMLRLERGRDQRVVTARGSVRAERIVLAMNAWSLAVPELRRGIFVITSDDALTGPAASFIETRRWKNGPVLTDSAVFVSGYRPTRDGRIVAGVTGGAIGFGSLQGVRFEGRTPREGDIAEALKRAFGAEVPPFVSSWRGPIDRTPTGLPVFGPLPGADRIWFGYGFSGNGIVGCHVGARILASLVLRRRDEWSMTGLVRPPDPWMPPEPFRYVGAHLVRAAVRQKDRLDVGNHDQGWLGSRLAALAPGGIVTTRSQ